MTAEMKALIWARNQKGNILNNTNVDCFIAGYEMASQENKEAIHKTFNKFFEDLPDKLEEEIKNLEARTLKTKRNQPKYLIERHSVFIALRDVLKQCRGTYTADIGILFFDKPDSRRYEIMKSL